MKKNASNFLVKHPSAWIPITMSLAALVMTALYLALFGVTQEPAQDEGTVAHIFQLLMAGQVPILAYFSFRWLPRRPKQALRILTLQVVAAILAFAPVFFLEM